MTPRTQWILIFAIAILAGLLCAARPALAESQAVEAISTFAARAEFQSRIGNVSLVRKPANGDIDIEEQEFFLGEPRGTGLWARRTRAEVNTTRIRPLISIGKTRGGQWRIPVKQGKLRAVIPGYAERHVLETNFNESTNIPGVFNKLGIVDMDSWSYSLGTRWRAFSNRNIDFTFIETKVRANSACTTPDCRPTMRADIWRLELYPTAPGRLDWDLRLERHDRERFPEAGYVIRARGEYDLYRGLKAGLTLGANINGMTPAGDEFSEVATHLVFQYLNGASTSFNQFYLESFGYYKLTLGYDLEF